jgi:hypothetical protein
VTAPPPGGAGLGLGLAIARHLVPLTAEPCGRDDGRGAARSLCLPVRAVLETGRSGLPVPGRTAGRCPCPGSRRSPERVLTVDDEPTRGADQAVLGRHGAGSRGGLVRRRSRCHRNSFFNVLLPTSACQAKAMLLIARAYQPRRSARRPAGDCPSHAGYDEDQAGSCERAFSGSGRRLPTRSSRRSRPRRPAARGMCSTMCNRLVGADRDRAVNTCCRMRRRWTASSGNPTSGRAPS